MVAAERNKGARGEDEEPRNRHRLGMAASCANTAATTTTDTLVGVVDTAFGTRNRRRKRLEQLDGQTDGEEHLPLREGGHVCWQQRMARVRGECDSAG